MAEHDFTNFMDYQIMTDYLISNTDRHMKMSSLSRAEVIKHREAGHPIPVAMIRSAVCVWVCFVSTAAVSVWAATVSPVAEVSK